MKKDKPNILMTKKPMDIRARLRITGLVLAMLILIAGTLIYQLRENKISREAAYARMNDQSQSLLNNIDTAVSQESDRSIRLASYLYDSGLLNTYLLNTSNYDAATVVTSKADDLLGTLDHTFLTNTGGIGILGDSIHIDISRRAYFDEVMQGNTVVVESLIGTNGQLSSVIATPIKDSSGQIVAVFGRFFTIDEWEDLIFSTASSYLYKGVIMTNSNFEVIMKNNTPVLDGITYGTNLLDFIQTSSYLNRYQILNSAIYKDADGCDTFKYRVQDKETKMIYFYSMTPTKNGERYLVTINTEDYLLNGYTAMSRNIWFLLGAIIIDVVLIVIIETLSARRRTAQLRATAARYQGLLASVGGGVYITANSKEGKLKKLLYLSDTFSDYFGYTFEDLKKGTALRDTMIYKKDRAKVTALKKATLSSTSAVSEQYRVVDKNGRIFWINDRSLHIQDDNNDNVILTTLTNIDDLVHQQTIIDEQKERYELAASFSDSIVFELDAKDSTIIMIDNFDRTFGFDFIKKYQTVRKAMDSGFVYPDDTFIYEDIKSRLKGGESKFYYEVRLRKSDGAYIWCSVQFGSLKDQYGNATKLVGRITDINSRIESLQSLKHKADSDPLTGLFNKEVTQQLIAKALTQTKAKSLNAFVLIDIDEFKKINDAHGHFVGDEVIRSVALKIKRLVRGDDIVGRIGGDEFVIYFKNISNLEVIKKKAAAINRSFIELGELWAYRNVKLTCSVGVSLAPTQANTFNKLYLFADAACYYSKNHGRNQYTIFDPTDTDMLTSYTNQNKKINMGLKWFHDSFNVSLFHLLYNAENYEDGIQDALNSVITKFNITNIAILKRDPTTADTKGLVAEIFDGNGKKIDHESFKDLSFHDLEEGFNSFDVLYNADSRTLINREGENARRVKIGACLYVKMKNKAGDYVGIVGFNDKSVHIWGEEEQVTLSFLSYLLAPYIEGKNGRSKDEYHQLLVGALPNSCYIIDNENYQLIYFDEKMLSIKKKLKLGVPCYQASRGLDKPCEQCVIKEMITSDKTSCISPEDHANIGLRLNWEGHDATIVVFERD